MSLWCFLLISELDKFGYKYSMSAHVISIILSIFAAVNVSATLTSELRHVLVFNHLE